MARAKDKAVATVCVIFDDNPVHEDGFMEQVAAKALKLWVGAIVAGTPSFNLLQARCASSLSTYTFE